MRCPPDLTRSARQLRSSHSLSNLSSCESRSFSLRSHSTASPPISISTSAPNRGKVSLGVRREDDGPQMLAGSGGFKIGTRAVQDQYAVLQLQRDIVAPGTQYRGGNRSFRAAQDAYGAGQFLRRVASRDRSRFVSEALAARLEARDVELVRACDCESGPGCDQDRERI